MPPEARPIFRARTGRPAVRAVLVLLVTALALLNAVAYHHARAFLFWSPPGERTAPPESLAGLEKLGVLLAGVRMPRPATRLSPEALGPGCRRLTLRDPDGPSLAAWYCDRGPGSPLVTLFHGYGGEKSSLVPEGRAFLDLGASVMLVDFRGSGESGGDYTSLGVEEAADVATAFRFARSKLTHAAHLLYGRSMGAAAVLRAVDRHGVAPDGVMLEAVFDTLLNSVGHRFRAMGLPEFPGAPLLVFWGGLQLGFNGFAHRPVDDARSLRAPVLIMHGSEDVRALPEDARRVYGAVPGEKRFRLFDGIGHGAFLANQEVAWRAEVRFFMDRALRAMATATR